MYEPCTHAGHLQYSRRTFSNGTIHYGVQCNKCLSAVKTEKHNGKLWIKHSEIPSGETIHDWIETKPTNNGGLF